MVHMYGYMPVVSSNRLCWFLLQLLLLLLLLLQVLCDWRKNIASIS